jgi:hypothetical protein
MIGRLLPRWLPATAAALAAASSATAPSCAFPLVLPRAASIGAPSMAVQAQAPAPAPQPYVGPPPGFDPDPTPRLEDGSLSPQGVTRLMVRRGLTTLGIPRLVGDVYIVDALDRHGLLLRHEVHAKTGRFGKIFIVARPRDDRGFGPAAPPKASPEPP